MALISFEEARMRHEEKNMKHRKNNPQLEISLISRYSSRKAWEEAAWSAILAYLVRLRSSEVAGRFLNIVLTALERRKMLTRAAALDRIRSGKSYREIGEELWLIPQTISTIKKALRESSYRSYHERGKTERVKKTYSPMPKRSPKRRVQTKYGTIEFSR
jgi:Trp operon repressor